jgi:hypothetical protein
MSAETPVVIDFTALQLGALGHADPGFTGLGYQEGSGAFRTAVVAPTEAPDLIGRLPVTAEIFFGVNTVRGPARRNSGRGTEADVTRLTCLWVELDVKPGACPSLDVARAIIASLSIILGTRPSVIVESGHGLHAYWPISDGHINGDFTTGHARALMRRWGRLAAVVADKLNISVDPVFDLARMMRVPGTVNNKDPQYRVPVIAYEDTGSPLTIGEIDERLTEMGICQREGDDEATQQEEISPPSEWKWADKTCPYIAKVIDAWATDGPKPGGGRNPWAFSQYVRLACAHRLGCITDADHQRARETLRTRIDELVQTTEPRRQLKKFEIADMIKYGTRRAAAKTDEQCRAELGSHQCGGAPGKDQEAPGATPASAPARRPRITWANSIDPEPVSWVWRGGLEDSTEDLNHRILESLESSGEDSGRIAAGTLAVAAGREGVGKSCWLAEMGSRISTGRLPGAWYGKPQNVLCAAVEDSWKHTIVPRYMAAGADLSRIGRFDVITEADATMALSLPVDNHLLEQAIVDNEIAAVFLDPLLSMISDRIDTHRERDVRQALDPLAGIAERTGAVIIGLAHFNKGAGSDVSARITGSGAFKNVPRAVFGFERDPDTGDCVLTQSKNSLGRYDLPSLRYRIEGAEIDTPKGKAHTGRYVGLGISDKSVADILETNRTHGDDRGSDGLTPAQRFIIAYVESHGDENDEVSSSEVIAAGHPAFTEQDLVKARNKIKDRVLTRKAGMGRGWVWSLASKPEDSSGFPNRTPSDLEDSEDSSNRTLRTFRESSALQEIPRRPGCVCTNQPRPCYHCEAVA